MNVKISDITTLPDLQARVKMDLPMIEEIADQMKNGAKIRPILVYRNGGTYYLLDGHHRYEAAKSAGMEVIDAQEVQNLHSFAEAVRVGIQMNSTNGLRFTREDVVRSISLLLKHRPETSIDELSKIVHRGKSTVYEIVKQLSTSGEIELPSERVGADGKTRKTSYEKREISPQVKCSCADCKKTVSLAYIVELKNSGSSSSTDWIHHPEDLTKWFCSEECLELYQMAELEDEADEILAQAPADEELKDEVLEDREEEEEEEEDEEETSGTFTMTRGANLPPAEEPPFAYPCPICGSAPTHLTHDADHSIACMKDAPYFHVLEVRGASADEALMRWDKVFRDDTKIKKRVRDEK